ncbi:hypothetical protein [Methylorubrum populi]|uniref:Uncharacterized protein n=1 Tax=Methylorubrum populi TaxID=223967 RepID=A0A833JA12_9HYPH|nr:hypothetical protein [Methylorubrum populi]KAB7788005.1 hypothetical protein F8B43_0010 [Methylorubrum populi]
MIALVLIISGACVLANFSVLAMLTDGWRRGDNDPRLLKTACALVIVPMALSLAAAALL